MEQVLCNPRFAIVESPSAPAKASPLPFSGRVLSRESTSRMMMIDNDAIMNPPRIGPLSDIGRQYRLRPKSRLQWAIVACSWQEILTRHLFPRQDEIACPPTRRRHHCHCGLKTAAGLGRSKNSISVTSVDVFGCVLTTMKIDCQLHPANQLGGNHKAFIVLQRSKDRQT